METDSVHALRLERARALMERQGFDYLLVGPSADLVYLLGAYSRPSERMTLFILPSDGPAYIVLPAFEAPGLPELPEGVQAVTWGETDRPTHIGAELIGGGGHERPAVAVADRLWSVFLLGLQAELPMAVYRPAGPFMAELRQIKSEDELKLLAASGAIADEVFASVRQSRFEGRTEMQIAQEIASMLKERGLELDGVPIVGSGPNSASPHHHSGERTIEKGDAVVLDFGGTLAGYFSDITRTVFVGELPGHDSEETRVYNLVAAAQEAAVRAARPGMTCEQLDAVARDIITQGGYGDYFIHRLGHGIGLDGHEPPYIVTGNKTELRVGMSFSIEPGVYLPGRFGVRVEDIVYLTESGAVRANNAPREMLAVQ
jgi:Xaa-Pro aminopeptidase